MTNQDEIELKDFVKLVQRKSFLEGYNRCLEDNKAILSLHVDTAVAAEREACAKLCQDRAQDAPDAHAVEAILCAAAIRSRGVQ